MPNLPPPPPPPPEPEDLSAPYGPSDRSGWSATGSGEAENLASVGRRVIARIVDFGLFFVAAIALGVFFAPAGNDGSAADTLADTNVATSVSLILLVVGMAYEVGLIATRGQTIGKIVMNIRVVNADSGAIPAAGSSFVRWAVPSVFALIGNWVDVVGLLAIIVYLSLVWGRRRQGWHDKAANTIVVNT